MSGDVHVQFCERPWGRFLRATLLVICVEREDDARELLEQLEQRLGKGKLRLSLEKTSIVKFRRPGARTRIRILMQEIKSENLGHLTFWVSHTTGRKAVKATIK